MPPLESIPAAVWVIAATLIGIAALVYTRVVRWLARRGGRVRSEQFALPELLMTLILAGFFAMMMVAALRRQETGPIAVQIDSVLPNSLLFVLFSLGILAFLHFVRRQPLGELFGLARLHPLLAGGWAIGLLAASYPLTGAANFLTLAAHKTKVTPQPLIELFNEVARQGNHLAIAQIFFAGVIVAPCCEEFLFRGFFYGVWKRYLGALGAGFLVCLLFAAFHNSLAAFAGLFVLAACLNLAYERTGSLLVPIAMHALFNFTSLLVLYVQARLLPES